MDGSPKFIGGNLALDFHNTASWDVDKPIADNLLDSYQDTVAWTLDAGATDPDYGRKLLATAEADQTTAAAALSRIVDLRQVVHDVFTPVAGGHGVPRNAIDALNVWVSGLPLTLQPRGEEGFAWDWSTHPKELVSVVWPVVWSAAELLRSSDLERVGGCELDGCGWLFVDRSRRHNRKWCQMEVCGNRAKARRHYHRASKP